MSNSIYYRVDVLASSLTEMNNVAESLKQPSSTLVDWIAEKGRQPVHEVAENIKRLLAFVDVGEVVGFIDSIGKTHQFGLSFPQKYHGIVDSHLLEVSRAFPAAVFLLEYFDPQFSYSGKKVIRADEVVQHIHDGSQKAQAVDWVKLDIFAPFRAEYDARLPFGSLWKQWVDDMISATDELKSQPTHNLA